MNWCNFDDLVDYYYNSGEYLNKGGPVYKQPGGIIEQGGQFLEDKVNPIIGSEGVGNVAKFLYKSAYNDPNAIDALGGKSSDDRYKDALSEKLYQSLKAANPHLN